MTELQEKLLKLLKVNDELCRKYDIDYYLLGGSLIGAMRHGGFIPWDDDADVIMTRDNWEKYYECTKGNLPEGYKISSQNEDINVAMPINRLTETGTTGLFRYHLSAYETAGTQIDIFVMDPVPDTEEDREIYRNAIAEYSELTALHVTYAFRFGKSTNFTKNWEKSQKVGKRKVLDEIVAKAFHYSEEESQLYAQRFAGAPHFWPKEIFGKPQYVPFEDTMLPIPERPGDCLVVGYDDDWKYIPRSGSNLSTHEFAVRNYLIPSHIIWEDYLDHADNDRLIERFIERKYEWERQFDERFGLECEIQKFAVEKIKCKYEKVLKDVDVRKLVQEKKYEEIEKIFEEYVGLQSNNRLVGSASLTGRIQYYRRNHPLLIDIGDDAVYAVIKMLLHYQKLGVAIKIMGARKEVDRPLTDELKALDENLQRVRRVISTYGVSETEECRKLTDEGLAQDPENPFYIKHDIFLKVGASDDEEKNRELIEQGLIEIPEDSELLLLKAESLRTSGKEKEALEVYEWLIEYSDNGLVLKRVQEICKELYEKEDSEENLNRWLKCRQTCGEAMESSAFDEDAETQDDDTQKEEDSQNGKEEDEDQSSEKDEKDEMQDDDNEGAANNSYEDVDDTEHSGAQIIRLELLREFDEICGKHGLEYFISGKTLLQAHNFGSFIDKNGGISAMMTAEDALKFQSIVNGENRKDRVVESMLTNTDYFRIPSMRYINTNTLDMSVATSATIKNPGIYLSIEILRPREKNKVVAIRNRFLEKGWEARNQPLKDDRKTVISRAYVNRMCKIYGCEKAARKLFETLTKGSSKEEITKREQCFVKNYNKKRKYLNAKTFAETARIKFEDGEYSVAKDYETLLEDQFGNNWKEIEYKESKVNEFTRIIDHEISFSDYIEHMEKEGIDLSDFQDRWKTSNWRYRAVSKVTRLASRHWYILAAAGERYNLYQKYKDSKDEIMRAYYEENTEKVGELIGDYYEKALEYIKRRLIIFFDQDLFNVLLWYVKEVNPGEAGEKLERRLIHRQEKQEWSDLARIENGEIQPTQEKS